MKRFDSAVLATPPDPVSEICGKYAALATPIRALAATISCSAAGCRAGAPGASTASPSGTVGGSCLLGQRPAARESVRDSVRAARSTRSPICSIRRWVSTISPRAEKTSCSACRTSTSGADAAALANLGQPQRLFARRQRPLRNLELEVERAQIEVKRSNLADEARDDGAPSPLAGGDLCARGFGGAAELAPEVELPREGAAELHQAGERQPLAVDDRALRVPAPLACPVTVGYLSACVIPVLRRRLLDARRGDPQVEVLRQRRSRSAAAGPRRRRRSSTARRRATRRQERVATAAEFVRRDDRRPLVVRPGGAGRRRGERRER